jgi:quercetin dioxygenase-like cupin family protein
MSEVAPGATIPIHLHQNEDELILVHQGSGKVTLGDESVTVATGAILYAPRGVWHGVENTSSNTLIWCATYSPPGFEQFFRETGVPPDSTQPPPSPQQVEAAAKKYGMIFKNP